MKLLLTVTLICFVVSPLYADTIYLKEGRTLKGKITFEDDMVVKMQRRFGSGSIESEYLKSNIDRIEKSESKKPKVEIKDEATTAPTRSTYETISTDWIDANELGVGKIYKLSKVTPLMPEKDPVDPMRAMANMEKIKAGSFIQIKEVGDKRGVVWYSVKVNTLYKETKIHGWINSIALMSQDLEEVK